MKKRNFIGWMGCGLILLALAGLLGPRIISAQTTSDLAPDRLRCEYKVDPLGIDVTRPRLSWIVTSKERGRKQTAYRILVASTPEKLGRGEGDRWDSGQVKSDETAQIVYPGAPLLSQMECFWKVMVWDNEGRPSGWSETAKWSMGLLAPGDWKAQWIGHDLPGQKLPPKAYLPLTLVSSVLRKDYKVYLPSPFLRKSFTVKNPVRRAVVYASALGLYELHLNGRRVGADDFTPGWSDYNKRVYYQTYDVTALLHSGENAIGAILADGWYAGNVGWLGQRYYGSKLRLRLQLQLEYADGTAETVATDGSWRAALGPIREADIQAGEFYDARLEMPGWSEPGFDESKWKAVDTQESIAAAVEAYPGIPVRQTKELKPIKITEPKPGVFVFNMGQNFSGWARLRVKGKAGDKVVLRFAEMLNPDGTIYTKNLRTARATDTYILKGGGEEIWEPRFTYHGFQYLEVTDYPGTPTLDDITGIVAHSDLPFTGAFTCSHPLVNKLYSNLTWGQRSNYFEVPTDCPQRDERLGWTGDTQTFIRTAAYNMDVAPFFTKWLTDLNDGQDQEGRYPDVAPRVTPNAAAGWGDAGIICPWTIYQVYGDRRLIEKHYPAMTKYIKFLESRSPGYLSPPLGTYGDWLNVNDPTPKDLIATAYFAYSTRRMAEMARAIGKEDDAKKYEALFANVCAAFDRRFVSVDGKLEGNSQTAYLLALRFGLLPENMRGPAGDQLVDRIQERDWSLSTGFLGAGLLLPTLTDIGRTDVAYRLLLNTRYPSWGYSINLGATTVWERWDGYTLDKGFNTPSMNSFNHYAFGACGEWMFSAIAGIDTDGPGFKKILIHPRPGGDLTWAKATYDSIRGLIIVSWQLEGDDFKLELTIPANTAAAVFLPAAKPEDVLENGRPAAESPGVHFLRMEPGAAVFEVGSGNYFFLSRSAASNGP